MSWTSADRQALIDYTYTIDSDDIKAKERIKQVLLKNRFIIHALNNQDLDEDEPDSYFGASIFPYYVFPDTQTSAKTYICYEISSADNHRYWGDRLYGNGTKIMNVIFHVLSYYGDGSIIDDETGIPRHDLITALIQDAFNYTTYIGGGKLMLVSDEPNTTDTKWVTRTLTFQEVTDNNLVKSTKYGSPKLSNKEVQPVAKA